MGKYLRKTKGASEVALLDTQSSLGVRTRAKTLALQRLQRSSPAAVDGGGCGSYMQLRSRRLQKPPIGSCNRRHTKPSPRASNPSPRNQNTNSKSPVNSSSVNKEEEEEEDNVADEASCGENLPEFEARERTTRESTPCSLIRDPDAIQTAPGSSTRPTSSSQVQSRVQNPSQRHIPTTNEMDEFFSDAEEQQQRQFIEKYNYDPVNDKPLPGRYEWEKINP